MKSGIEVNRSSYPFRSHWVEVDGGRMHYVDEGEGRPVVMVHGTPTWSFLYRHVVAALAPTHRVIAPDLLGFGLSDKPREADYRPAAQARRLGSFLDRLEVNAITLVVHDFGGPIGLSYAIEHPENVRALVLFNTWSWSLAGTPAERVSRFMSGAIGRFLYTRLNFSPRVLLPMLFADRGKLTRGIHRHYLGAFPTASDRHAPWVYARELIGSSEWYESVWASLAAISDSPALLLWGMRDPAFGADALERWKGALVNARTVEFADAGHFVQEEAPEEAIAEMLAFLSDIGEGTRAAPG
jgi:pimeloyl-ACP methyl ester carboxylesterase